MWLTLCVNESASRSTFGAHPGDHVTRLSRRLAILVPLALAAACTAPTGAATSAPGASRAPTTAPAASPSAAAPTLPPTTATSSVPPATGETAPGYPDVSVEPLGGNEYRVTVADPEAKVWRLTIRAAEGSPGAALRIVVTTGDIRYAVDATVITPPAAPRHVHLRRPNAAAICEPTTGACLAPDGVRTPGNPSRNAASFTVTLDPDRAVTLTGATAAWADEPFVRGPWQVAEPLTLGG